MRHLLATLALAAALPFVATGCATNAVRAPLQVSVAGIDPIAAAPTELRFTARLRVQNPNDAAVDYSGVHVDMLLRGQIVGSGVADARGTVPRYGEAVIAVPVTVTQLSVVRQAVGLYGHAGSRIDYLLQGHLAASGFADDVRFQGGGEIAMPAGYMP